MLEKEMIQSRGFKNVARNGRIIGFQVPFRTTYYRGIWASMLEGALVTVDGEKFGPDKITISFGGRTFTQAQLAKAGDIHWAYLEPAVLTVTKSGGLKLGEHDVEVSYTYRASYMPPSMDPHTTTSKRKMLLAG